MSLEKLFHEPKFRTTLGLSPRAADLRVVDVYVARLRGNGTDPRNPELILTVQELVMHLKELGKLQHLWQLNLSLML